MTRRLSILSLALALFALFGFAGALYEPAARAFAALGYLRWLPTPISPAGQLMYGVAGALMAGWAATLYILAQHPETHPIVARALRTGVVLWALIDSASSVAVGAYGNLVVNAALLGWAWWATRAPARVP